MRIDDSMHPFKRKRRLGPGPRKRPPFTETKDWVCTRGTNTPKHYVQRCVNQETGEKRTIKLKRKYKKAYNVTYRRWAASKAEPRATPRAGYRCRRTKRTRCK